MPCGNYHVALVVLEILFLVKQKKAADQGILRQTRPSGSEMKYDKIDLIACIWLRQANFPLRI